jgi:phosphoenolpyruvate carboxykinase (ATP)
VRGNIEAEEITTEESSGLRYNLTAEQLHREAVEAGEGVLTASGALRVMTGKYTGRSPKDKFIVAEPSVEHLLDWKNNRPLDVTSFNRIYNRVMAYLAGHPAYVFDGFAGADPAYRLPLRVITQYAWHSLFARQLFIVPSDRELAEHRPEFRVICVPAVKADPVADGVNSEAYIIISFEKRVVLIGGTEYAGEMKKAVFSVLNYLLPRQGVLPMHCSANVGAAGDVALFFGLSGTGKTTLSADPERSLVGDDEHGWTDSGIFNFEGGCYAKCIDLKKEKEPQIWEAIREGTVLENVVLDEAGRPAYNDGSITENTRAAYPVDYIPGALIPGVAGHPGVVVFLTADAFGVLPPVARLSREQAMYHFLSGYTSKLAGTERGVTEPETTFSACFGSPFLPLPPGVYAQMLGERIARHRARVYLVNTGWTGGPYGVGRRMDLSVTRAIIRAILDGTLDNSGYDTDPAFGLQIPSAVEGVPGRLLQPRLTWADPNAYDLAARTLAGRFAENMRRFTNVPQEVLESGPSLIKYR